MVSRRCRFCGGAFYYLCGVLDGFGRAIVHWEIRESMTEAEIEVILQRAKEKHPGATPRIISDNGAQFVAKDFNKFIRINGKIERWHKSLKAEWIQPKTPLSLEEARRVTDDFVTHYNSVRLHAAIGYVTPKDMLEGRQAQIHAERDRKLEVAREPRGKTARCLK